MSCHMACAIAIGSHIECSHKYCDSYHGIFPHSLLKHRVKGQPYQKRDLQADLYIYVSLSVSRSYLTSVYVTLKKMLGLQWEPADVLIRSASAL